MRFIAALLFWLVTTAALAAAIPAAWAQKNVVSEDGYAALAATAAKDPTLQRAMASDWPRRSPRWPPTAGTNSTTPSSFAA